MGLHDPFGDSKHKLWPKDGSGIAPIFLHASGMQHTIENLSTRAKILIQTSCQLEVYTQSYGPSKSQESCGNFETPTWESRDKMTLGASPVAKHRDTIRGKVVVSPKFRSWWILCICVFLCFVHAPKCSYYALTNLWFGLCRSMQVIELLVNLPSPISKLQHTPLPLKWCEPKTRPNSFSFCCLHLWTCNWVHQGAWGCVNTMFRCFVHLHGR